MLDPVSKKIDFPAGEREILAFWEVDKIFEQSLKQRAGAPEFIFYDGPPFATGLPHYGHLLAGTLKDIVPRYQTMRGHFVDRRFGWDCHGLPVEYEVEQDLKISGKRDIEKLGIDVFNERCRSIVLRYTREWREVVTRMGRWVDFDRDYKTMDPDFMESIWWVFKTLWDKNLIYEGNKILPYCPRCSTPLSNFETNQGYLDVQDPAITIRFAIQGQPRTWILAWTTTPWTLPSNMALAVGPEIDYVRIRDGEDTYLIAQSRLPVYYKKPEQYTVLETLPGRALEGLTYEPLFPYFAHERANGAFRVIAADFVSTEDGTGIVHIAPGFGEDDARVAHIRKIPSVCPIDEEGRFTDAVPDYVGREVKETDPDIIRRLKQEGRLVHQSTILHSYPHCWRCDKPLIYRAISTWFVRVESFRDRISELNKDLHWVPDHLRDGRFGKWLEQARDWAISRNRYWGTPLPIWRSEDGSEIVCIGSRAELEKRSGKPISDLHKHFVDPVTIPSATGKGVLTRVPEVLDCWFESGAMPYAQAHYPFENRAHFESHFPADFIAEGLDQTRGWFYTLMVLSTALFDRPAFRNVVVNGLVLAADGRKMSKRLKNYPDPKYMLETYGADALRLYLMNSPVVRAEDLRFSEDGVQQSMRHLLIPLWNAYSFFVTYARIDHWTPAQIPIQASPNQLDRWILSSLETLAAEVVAAMDSYDLQRAVRPFVRFIEDLTNWYIRRSRRRFWKSQNDDDKLHAFATLYQTLLELTRIAAPFLPFISEIIYRNLRTENLPSSVHLCDFPTGDATRRDLALEDQMRDIMTLVELGRTLRSEHNLKVRQPLAAMHIVVRDPARRARVAALQDIILDELNVKQALLTGQASGLAHFRAKANFSRLGPKLGPQVKKAAALIAGLPAESLELLASGQSVPLVCGDQTIELQPADVLIDYTPQTGLVVASQGDLLVGLTTQLNPELIREGLAREFVNKVQNMRKSADFEVTQRIRIQFSGDAEIAAAVAEYAAYVATETLALECSAAPAPLEGATEWDLNDHLCAILINPVAGDR
jgi:isoleucyl-tRNA synthetase